MKLSQFTYQLPPELIAQHPLFPRDNSKLLVVDRGSVQCTHHHFYELDKLLKSGDVLVRNNTKVIPARLFGQKESSGSAEILLLKEVSLTSKSITWEVLSKPGIKPGQSITFGNLSIKCTQIDGYTRLIEFPCSREEFWLLLDEQGKTPIPPYIHWNKQDEAELREVYQTIYAKHKGSAAAPTAGLHFTPELDTRLKAKGIEIEEVTLHVGLGTFLPVKTSELTDHEMHEEAFELTKQTAEKLNQAKKEGRRIISVGTTTTRVLETSFNKEKNEFIARMGSTSIYIYPGYEFKAIDGLITNFHLPESTLLMLISAFVSSPNSSEKFTEFKNSLVGKAYQEAIEKEYRFYSFGDAMLLV